MLHFTGEKNITFSMLLMTVSLMCSALLLLSKNHITKKNGVMRLVNNTVLVNSAWTHVSVNNGWMCRTKKYCLIFFSSISLCARQIKLCSLRQLLCHHSVEYGSYFPELKTLLAEKGISVQGQDLYLLENFVWPTREKTIKKGAKTAGLFLLNIACQLTIPRIWSYL